MKKSTKSKDALLVEKSKDALLVDKSKHALLVVLISASATVLVGFFQYVLLPLLQAKTPTEVMKTPTDITRPFVGRVTDKQTGKSIDGAKVSLEGKGLPPVMYTDSEGRFSFRITPDLDQIKIIVDAPGYKIFERLINPSEKAEPEDIRLTLAEPSPTPVEPVKQPIVDPKKELTLEEKKRRALKLLHSKSSTPNPN